MSALVDAAAGTLLDIAAGALVLACLYPTLLVVAAILRRTRR